MLKNYFIKGIAVFILTIIMMPEAAYSQAFVDNTTDASTPLPVRLLSFSAKKLYGNVEVNWITTNEKNNSHFNVQRSLNGTDFVKIGKVTGAGNAVSTTSYAYTDVNIPKSKIFYRLEQVDADGSITLSQVVVVNNEKEQIASLAVFPNPVKGNLITLSFENMPVGKYYISLIAINGAILYQRTFDHLTPTAITQLYLDNKPAPGSYMLRINNGSETKNQKLIIE
jgi:Secretion system C-terminal sorting domain